MKILAKCALIAFVAALQTLSVSDTWAKEKDKNPGNQKNMPVVKDHDHEAHGTATGFWKSRGYLGVGLTDLTQPLRSHFKVPKDQGVMIDRIEEKSPAEKAGLKVGDILVAVDAESIDSSWKLVRLVGKKKKDERVKLTLYRSGKKMQLSAVIEERKKPQIHVSRFLKHFPDGEFHMEFDPDEIVQPIEKSLEHLDERLKDINLDELMKLHQLEGTIEKRMQEVEKKIQELEKKMQSKLSKTSPRLKSSASL